MISHLETILPALFRKVNMPCIAIPHRILTQDGDFLDLDFYDNKLQKLAIITHGLEGNKDKPYVLGMAKALWNEGFKVVTWNFRGCGLQINTMPKVYHSGATYDLAEVVNWSKKNLNCTKMTAIGFSLGGNLTAKFMGELNKSALHIDAAVSISTPFNLKAGSLHMQKGFNKAYSQMFLHTLAQKVKLKQGQFRHNTIFCTKDLKHIKTLYQFDDRYTGPVHGFANAEDYYDKSSAYQFLSMIKRPMLIVSALNDPFLPKQCYPSTSEINNDNLTIRYTKFGGHVGFMNPSGCLADELVLRYLKTVLE